MNSEGNEKYYCSAKSTSIQPVQSFPLHRADCVTSLDREFQVASEVPHCHWKYLPLTIKTSTTTEALFNKTLFLHIFLSPWFLVAPSWFDCITASAFKPVFLVHGRKSINITQMETAGKILPLQVFNWFVFGLNRYNKYLTGNNGLDRTFLFNSQGFI